jgi:hypothetical protein
MDSLKIDVDDRPDQTGDSVGMPALCWICGHNPASTREHWVKKTDVLN